MTVYSKVTPGAPISGFYTVGDVVVDSNSIAWTCVIGGPVRTDDFGGVNPHFVSYMPDASDIGTLKTISGMSVFEEGQQMVQVQHSIITFTDVSITMSHANHYVGTEIYDMPLGVIGIMGASATFKLKCPETRAGHLPNGTVVDVAVGTATASNVSLTSTMVNILPKLSHTTTSDTTSYSTLTGTFLASLLATKLDGTTKNSGPVKLYLNLACPNSDDVADSIVLVSGTLRVMWIEHGDFAA